MIGTYRFIQDGKVVAEQSNLITTAGKKALLEFAAGYTKRLVGAIVVGAGATAANVADTKLNFETSRQTITNSSVDYANSAVVFKAQLPSTDELTVYEVGAHTADGDQSGGSMLLLDFNESTDSWSTGTWVANFSRLGSALRLSPSASTTASSVLSDLSIDLSSYSGGDQFSFAYRAANSFIANFSIRFRTDASNYFSTTINSPTSAVYAITTVNKSAMAVTGSPDWGNITSVELTATATAGGAASIDFDGVRIDDTDANREDSVLVSRAILGTPFVKTVGLPLDVEYAITL